MIALTSLNLTESYTETIERINYSSIFEDILSFLKCQPKNTFQQKVIFLA